MRRKQGLFAAVILCLAAGAWAEQGVEESPDTLATDVKFGYTRADVGGDGLGSLVRPESASESQVDLLLKWETRLFEPTILTRNKGKQVEGAPKGKLKAGYGGFSFGGTLGYIPVMTIAKQVQQQAEGSPEPTDRFLASFQQALTWDAMARLNWHVGLGNTTFKATDLSAVGKYGMNRLQDTTVTLGDADAATNWTVVENETGRWAQFWEVGGELRVFHNQADAKGDPAGEHVRPLLAVGFGHRHDDRYKRAGFFKEMGFDDPAERRYLRVEWNNLRLGPSEACKEGDCMSLSFAVDHEWSKDDRTLPSVTRFSIGARTDVLNLLGLQTE